MSQAARKQATLRAVPSIPSTAPRAPAAMPSTLAAKRHAQQAEQHEVLVREFGLVASAPNGIAKLRGLILDLAMSGKLISQDQSDKPISELLANIQPEDSKPKKAPNFRNKTTLEDIAEDEIPFSLPVGWAWVRFGQVLDFSGGGQPAKDHFSTAQLPGYVQLIQIRDLGDKPQPVYIKKELASKFCTSNDIMVGRYGASVGKVFWGKDGAYNVALVKIIDLFRAYDTSFLFYFLRSPLGQTLFQGISRSAQDGFNKNDIEKKLIPLLSQTEQKRIVAKVEELMALCDRMEAQQADAEAAHKTLVKTLLDALTQSQDDSDFNASWARISENFDLLFNTEESINSLKQAILQLAVIGKLTVPRLSDEPAAKFLNRIRAEKESLLKQGKIKKEKPLNSITDIAFPCSLPDGWQWAQLGNLVLHSEAGWSPNCEQREKEENEWGVLKVSAVSWGEYRPNENKALPAHLKAKSEYEVQRGDFLISRANTAELVARSVVVKDSPAKLMLSDKIIRLKLSSLVDANFVQLVNTSNHARSYYSSVAGGTSSSMKNVSREQILNLLVPVPPHAEQKRIVAKVDELMALCDALKARLAKANTLHEQLADALAKQGVVP